MASLTIQVHEGEQTNTFLPFALATWVFTNTAFLPYLALRPDPSECPRRLCKEDLSHLERVLSEDKKISLTYILAGIYSLGWAAFGRPEWFEAGGSLGERWSSLVDLLCSDRFTVASAVEMALFAIFQGWLVDDDWAKRAHGDDGKWMTDLAKYVPFFGLGYYMMARPPLPSEKDMFRPWIGTQPGDSSPEQ